MHAALHLLPVFLAMGDLALAQADDPVRMPLEKPAGQPWTRYTIDAGSRGADGVRVADLNRDGLPDLVTGWEEGGEVRAYLNPGSARTKLPWPWVTVGTVLSPEDAAFVDLNHDGQLDIVSSCEGRTRTVFAHLAPPQFNYLLDNTAWTTFAFPTTRLQAAWMFCLPLQVDGQHGIDLVLGAKGQGAEVGWLQAPTEPTRWADWQWHSIMDAGWIMSLRHRDVDDDGDLDIVLSDRVQPQSGIWWLENPGSVEAAQQRWPKHAIAGLDQEVMFLDLGDLDADGREDIVCALKKDDLVWARRLPTVAPTWREQSIPMPLGVGTGKGVAIADIDRDRAPDLVVTCENAREASGVFWLQKLKGGDWIAHDISGTKEGVKFDRIEMLDLDQDGDLDVVTCEETDNLGVMWYENPTPARAPSKERG